ncbi:hypothetical protein LCGC14_2685170, partial [marine sediment metagenome]
FYLGRAIIIITRSFHPVIVAILFVKAVGFGPFAGVLTLIVYSIGFVAKMLAEADANAFGFDQHCRFQMGGETGYGIVEYMMTGGSRRYGIPPTQMGG